MAELINNNKERLESLTMFTRNLIQGADARQLIIPYQPLLNTVTPFETMQIFDNLLVEGIPFDVVKQNVGKIINVFFKSLNAFQWNKPGKGHFLYYLMLENREAEKLMIELKSYIKKYNNPSVEFDINALKQIKAAIEKLEAYHLHYVKKENLLFPFIEKTFTQYKCLQLMWSFHDDYRNSIKKLKILLDKNTPDKAAINKELGRLFFVIMPVIFREEQIIYPVAFQYLSEKSWIEMYRQSFEIGWCYIEPPILNYSHLKTYNLQDGSIDLGTGMLKPEQINLLLNNLPVDITFVDENDEVVYFSGGTHRIFPRSTAILGRKVQNCHPPESVQIVNEIVDAFKNGKKNEAEFWIQTHDRFIFIRYLAVRDAKNTYKGTIEFSQDVTEIKKLQGEKRLLDWNQ